MERELKQRVSPQERQGADEQEIIGESDLLSSLEVGNEVAIPSVIFAARSGCGRCG